MSEYSNSRDMSKDDLQSHLRAADATGNKGRARKPQDDDRTPDVGPLVRELDVERGRPSDLPEGDHTAAKLAAHRAEQEKAVEASKKRPASLPVDSDFGRAYVNDPEPKNTRDNKTVAR